MCFVYERGDVVDIIDPEEEIVDSSGDPIEYAAIWEEQESGYLIYPLKDFDLNLSYFDFDTLSNFDKDKDLVFCDNIIIYPLF